MSKRFKHKNAEVLVAHLRASGRDPDAKVSEVFDRTLDGGCSDPGHCLQHSGRSFDGEPMRQIETSVSGSELHRLAVQLHLIGDG